MEETLAPTRRAKIQDFGEKIAGARKDALQDYETLLQMPIPENLENISLPQILPSPDYARLIEEGFDEGKAAMLRAVRDIAPRKPIIWGDIGEWGESMKEFQKAMLYIVSKSETVTLEGIYEILGDIPRLANRIALYKALGYPFFLKARGWEAYVGKETFPKMTPRNDNEPEPTGIVTFWMYFRPEIRTTEVDPDAALKDLADQIKKNHDECVRWRRLWREKYEPAYYVIDDKEKGGYLIGRYARHIHFVKVKDGFTTKEEANQYAESNKQELNDAWKKLKLQPTVRNAINEARLGPAHREGDVTPEAFSAAFSFRGVQFGNYMEAGRRELDLNRSYDALMDMALALDIPSQSISLDGQLGLAFGARGRSGAAAHYEPGQCVINLTKPGGPGCLAHEWFHAFDNYLCRLDENGESSWRNVSSNYASSSTIRRKRSYTDEINEAFYAILKNIHECPFFQSSKDQDVFRSSNYWSSDVELAARTFEAYIHKKLAAKGITNDFLVNIARASSLYPTHGDIAGPIESNFDKIFTAFRSGTKAILKEKEEEPIPEHQNT